MLKALIFAGIILVFTVAVFVFLLLKKTRPKTDIATPLNCLIAGVFLITLILFCPIYYANITHGNLFSCWNPFKALLLSLQMTLQVFTINTDSSVITVDIPKFCNDYKEIYSTVLSALYILAPMLTFTFVLSFFKGIISRIRLFFLHFRKDIYVFSELNDKSLTLAKSICRHSDTAQIVFNDVFEKNEELSYELIDEAHDIKSILFKKDILAVPYRQHKQNVFASVGTYSKKYNAIVVWFKNTYIFSKLDNETIESAKKIKQNNKDAAIVFNKISPENNFICEAEKIGADILHEDIFNAFCLRSKDDRRFFFAIGKRSKKYDAVRFLKKKYVFLRLNDNTIQSAQELNTNVVVSFNNAPKKEKDVDANKRTNTLISEAEKTKSCLFNEDILEIIFYHFHISKRKLFFFTIGSDETENISQALKLIEKYRDCVNTNLYVFSTRAECEMIIENADHGNLKVKKINEVRSLINSHLYKNGLKSLFSKTKYDNKKIKYIYEQIRFMINNHIYGNGLEYSDVDIDRFCGGIFDYLKHLKEKAPDSQKAEAETEYDSICREICLYLKDLKNNPSDDRYSADGISSICEQLRSAICRLRDMSSVFEYIENEGDYTDKGVDKTCGGLRSYIKGMINYSEKLNFSPDDIDNFIADFRSYLSEENYTDAEIESVCEEIRPYAENHFTKEGLGKLSKDCYPAEHIEAFYKYKSRKIAEEPISAVIIGLGNHGTEMLKALSWYCQLPGYSLTINAFDKRETVLKELSLQCPHLISEDYHGRGIFGDANYTINVHPGIDINSDAFWNELKKIENVTYVLVCLGDDEINISTAVALRLMYKRANREPVIQSIVYSNSENAALKNIRNFRNVEYNIDFIGSLNSMYSYDSIITSELDNEALDIHLAYAKSMNASEKELEKEEKTFWKYNYFYLSNISAAIHRKLRDEVELPYSGKAGIEAACVGRVTEHNRWNAFTRSVGYIYGEKRDDLIKKHNLLVPFDELPDKEKSKDS